MPYLTPDQRRERRDAVVTALTAPGLAPVVDLVVWTETVDDKAVALAASHVGTVELHEDGSHVVRDGTDPIVSEDPMAFLPYAAELASPGPLSSRENAYPYAAHRILSLFADPSRSPDVAVVHTPRHFFPDEGGHVGEHGSLDVIQSRAPLVLAGPGVTHHGLVDQHALLVDVGPTLAVLAGVSEHDLTDAQGNDLDGRVLSAYLDPATAQATPLVVGLLWDGAHCGDLLAMAQDGELPGVASLLARGTALRGGAVAQFPSVTLTNHTSILTGLDSGRHGVLGNVFYDRATGEQLVPNDASTWHRSADWLRPAVRTVFEMVGAAVPLREYPRTACINEAVDRGADYSTMEVIRGSGSATGAAGLGDLLPDPRESVHVHEVAHLDDEYFAWATQVDDVGLTQLLSLWTSAAEAPRLTWWSTVVTDAGHHGGGPRSPMAQDALRDADSRLTVFLDHLEALGVRHQVTYLLTADHGFEGSDPTVTGSWRPALDGLGIPYRDEGPGFVYLLDDE